jgi:hypothetical protein
MIFDIREKDPVRRNLRPSYDRPDLWKHRDQLAEPSEFIADRVGLRAMLRPPQIGSFDLPLRSR